MANIVDIKPRQRSIFSPQVSRRTIRLPLKSVTSFNDDNSISVDRNKLTPLQDVMLDHTLLLSG